MTPIQLWDCLEYTGYMIRIRHGMPRSIVEKEIKRLENRNAFEVDYKLPLKKLLAMEYKS